MKLNTCVSGAFTDRHNIKAHSSARQRRVALRIELDELKEPVHRYSDRAKELTAMIGLLDELIAGEC